MEKSPKKSRRNFLGLIMTKIGRKSRTKRGRNVILFIMCFIAASVFWFIIKLDDRVERDFNLPVQLVNVPDSVVVVDEVPNFLNVVLKGKGTQFIRYTVSDLPTFTIDFRQFNRRGGVILSRSKIESRLRDIFGQNVSVLVVNPDSIRVNYSTGHGFKLPLRISHKVTTSSGNVISGLLTSSVDSVAVYTIDGKRPGFDFVETEPVEYMNLSDTTHCQIAVKQLPGMRILPENVNVTIPVEPLVSKKRTVHLTTENVPIGSKLIFYPASVEVSYLVPMRLSNSDLHIKAIVDYSSLSNNSRNAKVEISDMPAEYRLVSLSQDSVEYVIER